jgi:hypothetical protein
MKGERAVYDASSEYPLPEGGYKKLSTYFQQETSKINSTLKGTVRLSFRVTTDKVLADIEVENSLSPELDEKAKQILRNGPAWIPAREHGQKAIEGYSMVSIDF